MRKIKKKVNHFLICLVVVFIGGIMQPYLVAGAATNGQVIVPSEISFYEDNHTDASDSSTSHSSTEKNNDKTSDKDNQRGVLPQTGSLIKNYGFIGMMILLGVILLFFLQKRRKDDGDEHEI